MSGAIDERVVEMQFNNSRFEQNVSTSISTLDKLKSALNLSGATKGMQEIEGYSNRFDLSGIGSAVETISSRFSVMGMIAVTALQNIVNKAVDAGERLVKAMSVDQINAGWGKYAEKTTSVQTIMAATAQTWEKSAESLGFVGSQMEFVNQQMDKLNWFTDETSYNFTDMVDNIGKFTANNIPLEEAVTAMQGIANWAAISGQNASAASRAMYNLAQAIGVGSVKLMDWRSIENANMGTAEFKNKVLEVAAANGQLKVAADGTYKTLKGTEVSVENFSQTLSEGWFDKNTLMSVLDQYGSFTNELYEFSEATGMTATDILELIDAQEAGTLSMEEMESMAKDCGMSVEDFQASLESLGSEENEFGRKTFKAAQEAKTFQDAIDATKDAASTKWMNIFENIFGDYEKARKVWTGFANFLYDTLVAPLEKLEEISEMFGALDGLTRIVDAIKNIFAFLGNGNENTAGIFGSLREGFQSVISPIEITVGKMALFFRKLKDFSEGLKLSEDQVNKLKAAGAGLAKILQFVGNTILNVWQDTQPLREAFSNLAGAIINVVLSLFGMASDMDSTGAKSEAFQKIIKKVSDIINKLANAIRELDLEELKSKFSGVSSILSGVVSAFNWLVDKITSFSFKDTFGGVIDWIKEKFNALKQFLSTIDFKSIFKAGLGAGVAGLVGGGIYKIFDRLTSPMESINGIVDKFKDVLGGIGDAINSFKRNMDTSTLKNIAIAIGVLAASLLILGFVNYENASIGVLTIAAVIAVLMSNLEAVDKINPKKLATLAGTLIAVAAAFLIFAFALAILAGAVALFALVAKMDTIEDGLLTLTIALGVVTAALYAFSKMSPKVLAGAASLLIVAFALGILAGALALFALVAKMDTLGTGLAAMTFSLLILVAALAVLNEVALGALAGAAALLVVSAAMLVLAGALAAFSAIASMDSFGPGLAGMTLSLLFLVGALIALGAAGPMVIVGAAALLIGAAACVALAIAVAAVGLALPLLGIGLQTLASGIANGVTALSGAVAIFGQDLGTVIEGIGTGLGGAIEGIGEGIAGAIEAIVSSIGRGIGEGISAISDGINDFSSSLSNVGSSITSFGDGVRSLSGISWTTTAVGIAEMAGAIKKVKGAEAIAEVVSGIVTELNNAVPQIASLGESMGTGFVTGISGKAGTARAAGSSVASNARSGVSSSPSWYSLGSNFAQGFINGMSDKLQATYQKGMELARAGKQGIEDEARIASPSRVATKLGGFFGGGFVNGIADKIGDAYDVASDMTATTIGALSSAKNLISKILEDNFTPTITPVLDLSNIENGLGGLYGFDLTAGLNGVGSISGIGAGNAGSSYSSELQELIALNRELLAVARAGGNVYLDSDVLAGTVNSRLGLL